MIRDPSDGSVREAPKYSLDGLLDGVTEANLHPEIPVSGLRAPSQKPAVQARLERSREWLARYFAEKSK